MGKKLIAMFKKNKATVVEPTKLTEDVINVEENTIEESVPDVVIDDIIENKEIIIEPKKKNKKMANSKKEKKEKSVSEKKEKSKKIYAVKFSDGKEGYTYDKKIQRDGCEVLWCNEVFEVLPFVPFL